MYTLLQISLVMPPQISQVDLAPLFNNDLRSRIWPLMKGDTYWCSLFFYWSPPFKLDTYFAHTYSSASFSRSNLNCSTICFWESEGGPLYRGTSQQLNSAAAAKCWKPPSTFSSF